MHSILLALWPPAITPNFCRPNSLKIDSLKPLVILGRQRFRKLIPYGSCKVGFRLGKRKSEAMLGKLDNLCAEDRRAGKKLVSRTSTRTAITVALEQVEQVGVSPCGFIYETLRLYPPVPFEIRKPTQPDTLPSGHHVDQNTRILICTYAMGRTTWLWGEDYLEVKPERWITKEGKLRREPPSKFFSFNAGPRNCPGKNLALIMMKATIATIFHYYNVQVIDQGQNVTLKHGVILHMKHGLMARIKNRWS
ncbi:Cytochrome P450-like protein [Theobroma cacao]|uniref:Cytochrome P450-like protein n=1 Tax=Theobroma cacao TaxID=3641 RepID=A0A061E1L9_THECC|nr:Cytochrome P450-like protein [Theobroma cacao]